MRQAQLKAEQDSKKQEAEGEPLVTVYLPVNYSTAKTEVLPDLSMISTKDRGKISVKSATTRSSSRTPPRR